MIDENKLIIKNNFDKELAKEWKELEKDSNISIFQSYDWNMHWQENCNHNFENIILLYYKNNKLILSGSFEIILSADVISPEAVIVPSKVAAFPELKLKAFDPAV